MTRLGKVIAVMLGAVLVLVMVWVVDCSARSNWERIKVNTVENVVSDGTVAITTHKDGLVTVEFLDEE